MKRLLLVLTVLAVCMTLALPATSQAVINLAGYSFDDNAFADYLYSVSGNPDTYSGGVNTTPTFAELEAAAVGSDPDVFAILYNGDSMTLGFSDNVIVNEAGTDFVVFEMVVPENAYLDVQLMGMSIQYAAADTGYNNGDGFDINAFEVDLSDFGIAPGGYVDLVTVNGILDFDLGAIGALHSAAVPEPATLLLLGAGLVGVGMARRRMKS